MASISTLVSTQSRIRWVPGVLSPGVKQQEREAGYKPPTSAEVKKTWAYTTLHECFHGIMLG
jgi:hypothetical protein